MDMDPAGIAGRTIPESPRRELLLAFAAFLLVYGQPSVVCARVLLSVTLPSLAVIVVGSMLLAAPTARTFVRQGGSISRLADFVIVAALVQIVVTLLGLLVVAAANGDDLTALARATIVLSSYPIAYYVVYRAGGVSPLPVSFRS
ncbi:hypothetical protein ACFR9U_03945 [Halorientalis brevis]|uniref:Integral membrane protein n=1 Tax=Halorientalis brevis TaxID=1126241 RepID=A0ABD6CA32_9EURY|nr:hypothetical protein [Halorientalis brevis]